MVAGKYSPNPNYIKCKCFFIYGVDVGDLNLATARRYFYETYENVSFNIYTYENELARKVHLDFIYFNEIQSIGRARSISNDITVVLLSDFPIHESDIYNWNQLDEVEEIIKNQNKEKINKKIKNKTPDIKIEESKIINLEK